MEIVKIVQDGIELEWNNKADLGADGKVVAEQMPQIGGRNLFVGSKINKTSSDYLFHKFLLAEPIQNGEICTITVKGKLGEDRTYLRIYNTGGRIGFGVLKSLGDDMHSLTFKWSNTDPIYGEIVPTHIDLYTFPNDAITKSTVEWATLVKGEVGTYDWIPSEKDFALADHKHLDKADLGADGKVLAEQMPETRKAVYFTTANANDITQEWVLMGGENLPLNGFWYINTIHYTDTIKMQVAYEYKNPLNRIFLRTCNGTVWNDWTSGVQVVNNLINPSTTLPLSANQGKVIWDHIVANQANWNKDTTYSVATQTANGLMSSTDKTKLDGVESGAQKNIMTSADKTKLDGIEANAQKNTITSVQGRTGAVTISKSDVGLGNVENIKLVTLSESEYNALSQEEKDRTDVWYGMY